MSLEEFDLRSSYQNYVIKRKKKRAQVTHSESRLAPLKSGYSWVTVDGATSVLYHGLSGSAMEVLSLKGLDYLYVGDLVVHEKVEFPSLVATAADAIDDGTIDYRKFVGGFRVKLVSERGSFAVRAVSDPEAGSAPECQVSEIPTSAFDNSNRIVIISITGFLVEKTATHFVIDWYGGCRLTIGRVHAEGDWNQLQPGQWFEATVSRRMNGEVLRAMLIGPIDAPEGYSEEELTTSYSSIPAAQLDPVK